MIDKTEPKKYILDACCGGRMFWNDKNHPNVIYIDKRVRFGGHSTARPNHKIVPDFQMDFRNMEFPDKSFKLVVFDPPHLIGKEDSGEIIKKFGCLDKTSWKEDIKKGFDECWRVLEDYGVLIFKWNETSIKHKEVLSILSKQPLFGNLMRSRIPTHWFCFMKMPITETETQGATPSFNKDLTATQQVATPKSASQTSLNPY